MSGAGLSKRLQGHALPDFDAVLWARLTDRLTKTLKEPLHRTPEEAARLAACVHWTVEQDDRGLWMTMTFPDGRSSAVGGEWLEEHDSLFWYVDDVAGLRSHRDVPLARSCV